ncbi:MAG: diguanylate cyclase [Mycobacterium sp.]
MTDSEIPTGDPPDSRWFQLVADSAGFVFFILRIRPDLALEFVNGGTRTQLVGQRFGTTPAEAEAMVERIDPESIGTFEAMRSMRPGQSMWVDLKWRHVSGRPVYSRGWVQCSRRADNSVVLDGAMQDITRVHEMEAELRRSEERHRLLAENAWDVIWTMALDGTITYISPAVERVRGFTPQQAMLQTLEDIHPPESAAVVGDYFVRLFAAVAGRTELPEFRGELEYFRRDGSIMIGELQVIPHIDADGRVVEILGVTRDVSERKRFESELTELAVTDPLTGLWNRRRTGELLSADLARAQRHGQALTMLVVDIDRFKDINDSHGHQTGDRVLMEVASRLRELIRTTDVVGRWGGEEFVILLRYCGLRDGVAAAEKLRQRINDVPFEKLFSLSVSIGAAELHADDDLTSWMARADAALYQAKRAGRNTVATG